MHDLFSIFSFGTKLIMMTTTTVKMMTIIITLIVDEADILKGKKVMFHFKTIVFVY